MTNPPVSDLAVSTVSEALAGRTLDVIVSGSIGAVESVRFIRALRRLGAQVVPWLTAGGAQFTTPTALAWAAGQGIRNQFAGDASHIALGDGCVIAPASANMVAKIAHGITDSPASALVASYLGRKGPVIALPNMHDSLAKAPACQRNLQSLLDMGIKILPARQEEGKQKFPGPQVVADLVSYQLNSVTKPKERVLISMGSTRGYIDAVRYISNYSSGKLGSLIAEELFRLGFETTVVAGPCPVRPRVFGSLIETSTNEEMAEKVQESLRQGASAAVLAASVLDFVPVSKAEGKIPSRDHERLVVEFARTEKIIAKVQTTSGVKVGFKLETGLTEQKAQDLARRYIGAYNLSLMVINDLADVDAKRHRATVFLASGDLSPRVIHSKEALANLIAQHVQAGLKREHRVPV